MTSYSAIWTLLLHEAGPERLFSNERKESQGFLLCKPGITVFYAYFATGNRARKRRFPIFCRAAEYSTRDRVFHAKLNGVDGRGGEGVTCYCTTRTLSSNCSSWQKPRKITLFKSDIVSLWYWFHYWYHVLSVWFSLVRIIVIVNSSSPVSIKFW